MAETTPDGARVVVQAEYWIVTNGEVAYDTFDWWESAQCWYSEKHGAVSPEEKRLFESFEKAVQEAAIWHTAEIDRHQKAIVKLLLLTKIAAMMDPDTSPNVD